MRPLHVSRSRARSRTTAVAAVGAALLLGLTACGSGSGSPAAKGTAHDHAPAMTSTPSMPGMPGMPSTTGMPSMSGMPSMDTTAAPSDTSAGYRFVSADSRLTAGHPVAYRFRVTGPEGGPVTAFAVEQTERLHFYAVRSDLTGFQHVHPVMAADGTWTAGLAALAPGGWRVFATFTPADGPGKGEDFVLSRTVTVPGAATAAPLPPAASTTTVDGYTLTVRGEVRAGMAAPLTVAFSKDGKPVTDLQPYLGTYAHLTAFRAGDLAFAHLHPTTAADGTPGGPELTFHAELPAAGDWRLFVQFRTGGTLHTAALTVRAA
ncbi:hypothetical protein AB0M29_06745 [Streptomyces sp. NPDC051976]|uniref:hypothetical protein n=1 Tax=Streptomyces sp. NPDC051976 TaxID=3154947 RepID=UPI0034231070